MIAGVLAETARDERRVALVPADVAGLVADGVEVMVQRSAGHGSGFGDADYRAAGARVVDDRAAIFAAADLVAWVKPPAFALARMPLRAGVVLLGFQDPLHRAAVIADLAAREVRSVAFEDVRRGPDTADFDALLAMSRIAGGVAYGEGRGLVAGDRRAGRVRALVLGCGAAGLAAVGAASGFGDETLVVGNRAGQRESALEAGATRFEVDSDGDPRAIGAWIFAAAPDLVVCAAVHRGSRAPVLLDEANLDLLGSGAVVVDLVAKAGGNCVAVRADSTVERAGVVITHRSNYPADRPESASRAYSSATATMIRRIAAGSSTDGA
ncbi:hypothetical protein [Nocardia arizonensis]|uniref:hypothetical protein n=1 Tax=Nocardia arizonensis TaxID=1141647 RepID=UPI0006D10425|nr:hypothetical protein [Nocardia arizonensis]